MFFRQVLVLQSASLTSSEYLKILVLFFAIKLSILSSMGMYYNT